MKCAMKDGGATWPRPNSAAPPSINGNQTLPMKRASAEGSAAPFAAAPAACPSSALIACPKLDTRQDVYLEKLTAMIENSGVKSVEVLMMQVPCCRGLLHLVREAAVRAGGKVPIRYSVISIEGEILETSDLSR